jgi:hypothetical protein
VINLNTEISVSFFREETNEIKYLKFYKICIWEKAESLELIFGGLNIEKGIRTAA